MSQRTKFLELIRTKDLAWLTSELAKRNDAIRTLKFELGFGTVDALRKLRTAKRERAQLLTLLVGVRATTTKD